MVNCSNDTLNGGTGNDTAADQLTGGLGKDTYLCHDRKPLLQGVRLGGHSDAPVQIATLSGALSITNLVSLESHLL